MTNITKTKAIVLLYPSSGDISSHNPSIQTIEQATLNCCAKADISILEVITVSDMYDYTALRNLITVVKEQYEPVTLVINETFRSSFHYAPIWCTIGVLHLVGLIDDVQVYERWNFMSNLSKKEMGGLKRNKVDLLYESLAYFRTEYGTIAKR